MVRRTTSSFPVRRAPYEEAPKSTSLDGLCCAPMNHAHRSPTPTSNRIPRRQMRHDGAGRCIRAGDRTDRWTVLEDDNEIPRQIERKALDSHTNAVQDQLCLARPAVPAPNSSNAFANRPPASSYAWHYSIISMDMRSRSRRAAVVSAGPPGGPSTSPSAASSMRY